MHSLVRTIRELHELLQLISLVSLKLMLALNLLRAAHGARLVHTEHDRDVLLALSFLVLNLSSCFKNKIHSLVFRFFLLLDVD